jgi:hypothetical protein
MLVVIAYFSGDRSQAVKLLDWMSEIGEYGNHDLLFVRDHRCEPIENPARFNLVNEIVVKHDTFNSWPQSANLMFEQAARYIEAGSKDHWLWLEPDSVPMKTGWLDDIEKAWRACGKPFIGDRVEVDGVPVHMSGVAGYPGAMSWHAGTALTAKDIAWDVQAAPQIVPKMHHTKLIEHSWEAPGKRRTFESIEQVRREIAPETVLFHSSKDGSLIDRLREQKRGDVKCNTRRENRVLSEGAATVPPVTAPTKCRFHNGKLLWK